MKEHNQDLYDINFSESQNENNHGSLNEIKKNNIIIQINENKIENFNHISNDSKGQINAITLNEEEIIRAKEKGFIILGKTGIGKTSLLNIICGKDVGKVGHTSLSETKN